jgi:hypothetical protein
MASFQTFGRRAVLSTALTSLCLSLAAVPGNDVAAAGDKAKAYDKWCFAWIAPPPAGSQERGALLKAAKWDPNSTITVAFLDGEPAIQAKVKTFAKKWTKEGGGPANVRFVFQTNTASDIRISFQYAGSWSVIGTSVKQIPNDQATMNFGWLAPDTPDAEYKRVVLHEFGHALGLVHEHQNPAGGIQWNKEQVYKDLSGPPNNWSKPVIDNNMFKTYAANETNNTKTDPQSIMMYPIPATWTTNHFSVGVNDDLSDMDKEFIAKQYP